MLKGAAWSVPAVVAVGATPAFAASAETQIGDQGAINASNDDAYTVSGTGQPGRTVLVYASGGDVTSPTATTTVLGDGTWSVAIDASTLPDGNVTLFAEGNLNTDTASVVKDTVIPTVDATTVVVNAPSTTGTISGTISEPASAVNVTVAGLTLGADNIDNTALTWNVGYSGATNNATYNGSVTTTDLAGNTSAADTFSWTNRAGTINV